MLQEVFRGTLEHYSKRVRVRGVGTHLCLRSLVGLGGWHGFGFGWAAVVLEVPARLPSLLAMHLTLEFGGGLELLLEKSTKVHKVDVQPKDEEGKVTMRRLLSWVKSNLIKERTEMFVKDDSVRPGVLVLINDCDWELCGLLDAELEEKDVVVFISTLHGG